MSDQVEVSLHREKGFAVITLISPVFRRAFGDALSSVLNELENEVAINSVILTGRKNVFLTGADLKEFMTLKDEQGIREYMRVAQSILWRMYTSRKVYLAAINGYCFGGGLELALACDLRLSVDEVKDFKGQNVPAFSYPEARLGVVPPLGGAHLLAQIVGVGWAKEMLLGAQGMTAADAYRIGLVNALTTPATLLAEAEKRAQQISQNQPLALGEMKRLLTVKSVADAFEQAQGEALDSFIRCCKFGDKDDLMSGFLEKQRVKFHQSVDVKKGSGQSL